MQFLGAGGLLDYLRSLGFGALLGSGILGAVHIFFPELIADTISLQETLYVGGLLGAGTHGLIDRALNKTLLRPFSRFISYYSTIAQALLLGRILGRKLQTDILKETSRRYFLQGVNDNEPNRPQIPPGAP